MPSVSANPSVAMARMSASRGIGSVADMPNNFEGPKPSRQPTPSPLDNSGAVPQTGGPGDARSSTAPGASDLSSVTSPPTSPSVIAPAASSHRRRAVVPAVSVVVAVVLTLAFGSLISHTAFVFFYPAVVLAVLFAGLEAGTIVAVAGA